MAKKSSIIFVLLTLGVFVFGAYKFRHFLVHNTKIVVAKTEGFIKSQKTLDLSQLYSSKRSFPVKEKAASNAGNYDISISSQKYFNIEKNKQNNELFVKLKIVSRVYVKSKEFKKLRIKLYCNAKRDGEYTLILDETQISTIQNIFKMPPPPPLKLPKNISEKEKQRIIALRNKFLEKRKKIFSPRFNIKKNFALFTYNNPNYIIEKGQQCLYFRAVLYDSTGKFIKESSLRRFPLVNYSSFNSNSLHNIKQTNPSVVASHKIPHYDKALMFFQAEYGKRSLFVMSQDKDFFKSVSISIDGIDYPAIKTNREKFHKKYLDNKKQKTYKYFCDKYNLDYPFGGNVKVKFKYKGNNKFRTGYYSFYLPPPPPYFELKAENNSVRICWEKLHRGLNNMNFEILPKLQLYRDNNQIQNFKLSDNNSYIDRSVFAGEPVKYTLKFSYAIIKTKYWSSQFGTKSYKKVLTPIVNPFLANGKYINVAPKNPTSHPLRIEYMGNAIYQENTGITAYKLLDKLIKTINNEKDMVLYDRDSRNYIIDEKYFALSTELKKQFTMREADYAFMLNDYSRQDGNGIEIWLFKKRVEGKFASPKTSFWKIAELPLEATSQNVDDAIKKFIAKIRQTLEIQVCDDTREKNIIPDNVICPKWRPLNQEFVIWNYEAICESIFLEIGNKCKMLSILSRDNWNEIFFERISRYYKGYSYIDQAERELLLRGRIWRNNDKTKSYYIQACDAFSGEVIGSRIFKGKLGSVPDSICKWLNSLRLSKNLKADFQFSKYHARMAKRSRTIWRPRKDLILRFGPYINRPKSYDQRVKRNKVFHKPKTKDFYAMVKRQWQDGYRSKAIDMLKAEFKNTLETKSARLLSQYYFETKRHIEAIAFFGKAWKTKKNVDIGIIISRHYQAIGKYRSALEIYDTMLQMKDCPKSIFKCYNKLARKVAQKKPSTNSNINIRTNINAKHKVDFKKRYKSKFLGSVAMFYVDWNDIATINYSSIYKNTLYKTPKYVPRKEIFNEDINSKNYFIDREKIYPEWAEKTPCRTSKLFLYFKKKLLNEVIFAPSSYKYGCWNAAYRFSSESGGFSGSNYVDKIFENWRYLNGKRYMIDEETIIKKRARIKIPEQVYFLEVEDFWNSKDPFKSKLNSKTLINRLLYFSRLYKHSRCEANSIYHYSPIRAFFELKKNPQIDFPIFKYSIREDPELYTARIKNGKDMIRHIAMRAVERSYLCKRSKLKLRTSDLSLLEMLAVDYISQYTNSPKINDIYKFLKYTTIPDTIDEYVKSSIGIDFLVYKAYKRNKKAYSLLKLLAKNRKYICEKYKADYIYTLAQAGYVKILKYFIPEGDLEASTLRWLPEKALQKYSGENNYLIFGTKNKLAAQEWMLKYNKEDLINNFFGKPPAEVYRDWKNEHYEAVKTRKKQ